MTVPRGVAARPRRSSPTVPAAGHRGASRSSDRPPPAPRLVAPAPYRREVPYRWKVPTSGTTGDAFDDQAARAPSRLGALEAAYDPIAIARAAELDRAGEPLGNPDVAVTSWPPVAACGRRAA